MLTTVEPQIVGTNDDGSLKILPRHDIEVLCSACRDPVSEQEEQTGICTSCGQPWQPAQSTAVHVTSTPMVGTARV